MKEIPAFVLVSVIEILNAECHDRAGREEGMEFIGRPIDLQNGAVC